MLKIGPHCLAQKQDYWTYLELPHPVTWDKLRALSSKPGYEYLANLIEWVDKKPTVIKYVSFHREGNLDDFRLADLTPKGPIVIGKPDEGFRLWQGDPITQARAYFEQIHRRNIETYPRIDIWEGPNEVGITPGQTEQGVADMLEWYAHFLAEFARLVYLHGRRAAIGSWATGTPPLNSEWLAGFRPALDAVRDYHAVLAFHEYDVPGAYPWGWNFLRYRKYQAIWTAMGYGRLPVVITECGLDGICEPDQRNSKPLRWRDARYYNGDAGRYWREFCAVYNDALCQDDYVLGATLYTLDTGCDEAKHDFDVGKSGFVTAISAPDAPSAPAAHIELGLYRVAVGAAWQRTGPGVQYPIALWDSIIQIFLKRDQAFRIVEVKNGWGRNSAGRWMSLKVLEKVGV